MSEHRVSAAYDTVAGDYERRFLDELNGKPRDRELLDRLAAIAGDPIVEVGCGPGQIGAYLRRSGRRVFGADLSREMATRAGARLCGGVAADMLRLPFQDRSVGAVVAFYSVIHLPRSSIGLAFHEFGRTLRSGGHVVVSAHEGQGELELSEFLGHPVDLPVTFYALGELTSAAEDAGLRIVRAERRQPYADEGQTIRLYVHASA